MRNAFTTYDNFFLKNTAFYGVMWVTLIELPFKIGNFDKHHL